MSGLFAVLRARAQLVPKSLLPLRGRIDFQVFAAVPNNNFVLIRGETEVDALRLAGEGDVRFDIDCLALVGCFKLLHEGFVAL